MQFLDIFLDKADKVYIPYVYNNLTVLDLILPKFAIVSQASQT